MKTSFSHTCLVVLPLLMTSGCNDGNDGPPPFQTGVGASGAGGEIRVRDLSDDQRRQLCDEFGAHLSANIDLRQLAYAVCLPSSLLLGGNTEQSCNNFLNDCVDSFLVSGSISAELYSPAACLAGLALCELDVIQIEGCINVNLELVYAVLERFSCRRAGDANLKHDLEKLTKASVCAQPTRSCLGDTGIVIY